MYTPLNDLYRVTAEVRKLPTVGGELAESVKINYSIFWGIL